MLGQLSSDILEFLERPSTKDFLFAARQFIDLLEIEEIELAVFYPRAHSALLDLYSAGFKFDTITLHYSSAESDFDGDIIFDNKYAGHIANLGSEAFYWQIFDPTYTEQNGQPGAGWNITDRQPSQGWLVDDFSDIYRDMKTELEKIDKIGTNEAVEDACWNLKWSFTNHWGSHCINALRYLHFLYYDGK